MTLMPHLVFNNEDYFLKCISPFVYLIVTDRERKIVCLNYTRVYIVGGLLFIYFFFFEHTVCVLEKIS